jgi:hypothetical protein
MCLSVPELGTTWTQIDWALLDHLVKVALLHSAELIIFRVGQWTADQPQRGRGVKGDGDTRSAFVT